jgi:hypothetical protein
LQIFVINLDHRTDRLKHIQEQLKDYDWIRSSAYNALNKSFDELCLEGWFGDREWIDPLLNTSITPGEIGCFASHYTLWQRIVANNEPALILEDDVELLRNLDIDDSLSKYDIVYLGYRELRPNDVTYINDELIKPVYPYLASSYYLSVEGARKLISTGIRSRIIPADEYLSIMIGFNEDIPQLVSSIQRLKDEDKLNAAAFKEPYFKQLPRKILGSDTMNSFYDQKPRTSKLPVFHWVTVATNQKNADILYDSAIRFNVNPINLGAGEEWRGGDMKRLPGGGHKINLLKQYLSKVTDDEYVIFMDGYDTLFNGDINDIKQRVLTFDVDILFAAEKQCWPASELTDKFPILEFGTEYRCPNDGLFVGKCSALKKFFSESISDDADAHLYIAKNYLKYINNGDLKLTVDSENFVFQCMSDVDTDEIQYLDDTSEVRNAKTRCRPRIIHGNGGIQSKEIFFDIIRKNIFKNIDCPTCGTSHLDMKSYTEGSYQKVGNDIYMMDFIGPNDCLKLIQQAEDYGNWESLYGDNVPGKEIRIEKFNPIMFNEMKKYFERHISKFVNEVWWPTPKAELRDAFIIKFEPGGQDSLPCHNDSSLVSGIVKLNNEYEGGETYWPRQHFSNMHQPVGSIVLWPGQLTHGHEGKKVTKGTKYNLVFWTKRFGE